MHVNKRVYIDCKWILVYHFLCPCNGIWGNIVLCCLRSISALRDHFVGGLSVCLSGSHTFLTVTYWAMLHRGHMHSFECCHSGCPICLSIDSTLTSYNELWPWPWKFDLLWKKILTLAIASLQEGMGLSYFTCAFLVKGISCCTMICDLVTLTFEVWPTLKKKSPWP